MRILKIQNLWLITLLTFFGCGGETPSISVQPSDELFEQEAVEKVSSMDILWVIDNSGSMRAYQKKVEDEIVTFMNNFTQKEFNDFQIGFIGTAAWQDLDFNNYESWNNTNENFLEENTPANYNYEDDIEDRFLSLQDSTLETVNCEFCDNGDGRPVSNFNNDLLIELRNYCATPSDPCSDLEDVNNDALINGEDAFITLIRRTITSLGTNQSGDERPFQSIQAARLNPNNSDFFRNNTHFATIIVSDEDDTSRPQNSSDFDSSCNSDDVTGYFACSNNISPSYFKSFLDMVSNNVLGATTHALVINPASSHPDNLISQENEYEDPRNGYGPYRRSPQYFEPQYVLECRTADIEGGLNNYQRFFGYRATELAELTGGVVASLCGDYSVSLDNIAKKIVESTVEFFLGENVPSQEILDNNEVFVGIKNPGEEDFRTIERDKDRLNGWEYNAENNSIVFFGDSIPDNGAKISVVFDRDTF